MDQPAHHATPRKVFQMLAWLTETRAVHEHGSDQKFTVDEMIERNPGRRDVTAAVPGGELDPEAFSRGVEHPGEERLDGLDLDKRDLAPTMARRLRVEPDPGEISIALEAASWKRPNLGDRAHRRRRFRGHVKGDDSAFPHAGDASTGVNDALFARL